MKHYYVGCFLAGHPVTASPCSGVTVWRRPTVPSPYYEIERVSAPFLNSTPSENESLPKKTMQRGM